MLAKFTVNKILITCEHNLIYHPNYILQTISLFYLFIYLNNNSNNNTNNNNNNNNKFFNLLSGYSESLFEDILSSCCRNVIKCLLLCHLLLPTSLISYAFDIFKPPPHTFYYSFLAVVVLTNYWCQQSTHDAIILNCIKFL